MSSPFEMSDDTPVYVISVAAQLSGMHPQTLRAYDKAGLVSPGRTAGKGRRYSLRDILVLREVQRLSQVDGVNLSGIKQILELESELERFRDVLAELTAELSQLRIELESTRAVAARLAGLLRDRGAGASLVPVRGRGSAAGQGGGPGRAADGPDTGTGPPHPALPAAEPALPADPPAAGPDSPAGPR
ncbi:MAG TPA: helix-turn-helix transcriptional regulator [Streptosporangiaceae bacterium]|nr:helix-turn-helix transcriptional regulator [Streptosporangiaceae bacterium]